MRSLISQIPSAHDKLLFTPGPLTTSLAVKQAMLHDAGSWHFEFNSRVSAIRERLLALTGVSHDRGWETVLLQGSGTYGVEAVFLTCVPPQGKVLVLSNGAYGERIVKMLQHARIDHTVLRTPEDTPTDPNALDAQLRDDPAITHVAMVHCETTTGILNPLSEVGAVTRHHQRSLVLDAMSSFGAYPVDLEATGVDYLISSANKCLEGVPGFAFVICQRQKLEACAGFARSLSLDLLGQLKGFDANEQFRFTPPTHSLLAFEQALRELELEGGFPARLARYQQNHRILVEGMRAMGFRPFLDPAVQSCVITAFLYRHFPGFDFLTLYRRLSDSGFIIYPGKLTQTDTFRIGSIGRLFPADMRALLHAIDQATLEWRHTTTAAPTP
ncbi:MAG: 2-aminoethylphosphonate--pyruvate transaminase [Verrucomicrobia bacterium]|nr:2-aminoethylphosphonate--pyruvate transaminase [Verrucomicrobiota bacterium]